jgi:hypothetical protein
VARRRAAARSTTGKTAPPPATGADRETPSSESDQSGLR